MIEKFNDISWKKSLRISFLITLASIPTSFLVGYGIFLIDPNWPTLLYGAPSPDPLAACMMVALSNVPLLHVILAAAFLIACGLAQKNSSTTSNHLSNYPRD